MSRIRSFAGLALASGLPALLTPVAAIAASPPDPHRGFGSSTEIGQTNISLHSARIGFSTSIPRRGHQIATLGAENTELGFMNMIIAGARNLGRNLASTTVGGRLVPS